MIIDSNNQGLGQQAVIALIKSTVKKLMGTKIIGDIPTDAKQLTPKQWVEDQIAIAVTSTMGVAGNPDDIQFNDAGSLGGSDFFTWNAGDSQLGIGDTVNAIGSVLTLRASGTVALITGVSLELATPNISSGTDVTDITIQPGTVSGGGNAGDVLIKSGDGLVGTGGTVVVQGGLDTVSGSVIGTVQLGNGVLPTTTSTGLVAIPRVAGTPTGAPPTGSMVYDTSANKLWIYNGSWRGVLVT